MRLLEDPDPTAKNSQNTRPEKKSAMYIDIDNDACSVWQSVGSICAGKPGPQIMLFARVRDYALCGSQSEGSIWFDP